MRAHTHNHQMCMFCPKVFFRCGRRFPGSVSECAAEVACALRHPPCMCGGVSKCKACSWCQLWHANPVAAKQVAPMPENKFNMPPFQQFVAVCVIMLNISGINMHSSSNHQFIENMHVPKHPANTVAIKDSCVKHRQRLGESFGPTAFCNPWLF